MPYGLKEDVLKKITQVISENSKVKRVLLYGSRAKGNYRDGSDIDLALIGEGITVKDLNSISLRLDELYLPHSFDLTIYQRIDNKELLEHIDRVGVVIMDK